MRKGQNPRRGRGRNGSMRPMGHGGGHRHNQGNGQSQAQGQFQQGQQGRHRRNPGALNRQYDSSGPEGKVRGTAIQLYERYKVSARENQASDRVLSEMYAQFSDHYYRLAAESGAFDMENQGRREFGDRPDGAEGSEAAMAADSPEAPVPASEALGHDAPAEATSATNLSDGVLRTLGAREPVSQPSLLGTDVETLPEPVAAAVKSAEAAEAGEKPRRRGRPRKPETASAPLLDGESFGEDDASGADGQAEAVEAAKEETAAPAPRRRGRPRKNVEADVPA